MKQVWLIFRSEWVRLMRSGGTYALLAFFYLLCGAFLFVMLLRSAGGPQPENPFKAFWTFQWIGNVVLVPLLTMRLLASPRKAGLLSSVLATPTSPMQLILGEFAAAYLLYLLCWGVVPVGMFLVSMAGLSPADGAYLFNFSAMAGGAVFCIGSGFTLVALGVFSSSLTRNGWLSGTLTACLILLAIMLPSMMQGLASFPEGLDYLNSLADFADGRISLGVLATEFLAGLFLLIGAGLVVERGAD
jgi:ABC-2 type transport system permease protein